MEMNHGSTSDGPWNSKSFKCPQALIIEGGERANQNFPLSTSVRIIAKVNSSQWFL